MRLAKKFPDRRLSLNLYIQLRSSTTCCLKRHPHQDQSIYKKLYIYVWNSFCINRIQASNTWPLLLLGWTTIQSISPFKGNSKIVVNFKLKSQGENLENCENNCWQKVLSSSLGWRWNAETLVLLGVQNGCSGSNLEWCSSGSFHAQMPTLLFLVFHHINSLGAMFETIGAFFSGGIRDQKTANRGMRHARHKMKEEKYARSDSKWQKIQQDQSELWVVDHSKRAIAAWQFQLRLKHRLQFTVGKAD